MVYLPPELINEILLWLPLKCVISFKCVSKSWLSLISHPHFAISHFERATAAREDRLVLLSPSDHEYRSKDLNASLHHHDFVPLNLNFLPLNTHHVSVLGSCRGFLLLYCPLDGFYVWNSFTAIHRKVSFSPIESMENFTYPQGIFIYMYGFGYDPSTDDYLIVQATNKARERVSHVEVFSVRANMWKEIESAHLSYKNCSDYSDNQIGWLFKDAIHWLAFSFDASTNVILAFDLKERSFSEVPLPLGFQYHKFELCVLRVLGESLNLCTVGKMMDSVEIWTMKEYKVQWSWTKTLVISTVDAPASGFIPIRYTKSGDIVGIYSLSQLTKYCFWVDILAKCNDKGQLLEESNFSGLYGCTVAVYTETLFSLPCHSEQAEEHDDH